MNDTIRRQYINHDDLSIVDENPGICYGNVCQPTIRHANRVCGHHITGEQGVVNQMVAQDIGQRLAGDGANVAGIQSQFGKSGIGRGKHGNGRFSI